MKRLPWVGGFALALVLVFVFAFTRTASATGPCLSSCASAELWAESYCYSIGCAPMGPGGNWFSCGTNGSGVGGYNYQCQCSCDGHLCGTGGSGSVNPSCSP
jgi:hypothetical protein